MKILLSITLVIVSTVLASATPTLQVKESGLITWRNIFDAGFKPKHLRSLEDSAVCYDQKFKLSNAATNTFFESFLGRTKFTFFRGNQLRSIWHSGSESVSREKVLQMVASFEAVFAGNIVKPFNEPDEVFDETKERLSTPEFSIVAEINGNRYALWFRYIAGFYESFTPHFDYEIEGAMKITRHNRVNSRDHPVHPPEGYEDYDITNPPLRLINHSSVEPDRGKEKKDVAHSSQFPDPQKTSSSKPDKKGEKSGIHAWMILLLSALLVGAFIGYRRISKW